MKAIWKAWEVVERKNQWLDQFNLDSPYQVSLGAQAKSNNESDKNNEHQGSYNPSISKEEDETAVNNLNETVVMTITVVEAK